MLVHPFVAFSADRALGALLQGRVLGCLFTNAYNCAWIRQTFARFADYGADQAPNRAPSMHKPPLFTFALSGVACFSVKARASEDQRARFAKADTHDDGALSREEAKAMPRVASCFDTIDANHDGKVTMKDIGRCLAAQHGQ